MTRATREKRVRGGDGRAANGVLGRTTLKRAGGSLIATVPAAARNLLSLTEGQSLAVSVEGNRVVMEVIPEPAPETLRQVRQPRYTLDQLVAGMDADRTLSDDEREWMDAEPVGREVW